MGDYMPRVNIDELIEEFEKDIVNYLLDDAEACVMFLCWLDDQLKHDGPIKSMSYEVDRWTSEDKFGGCIEGRTWKAGKVEGIVRNRSL